MSTLVEGLRQGLREIRTNLARAALTILAVALGIAAMVAMLGMLESMLRGMQHFNSARGGMDKIVVIDEPLPPEQAHLKGLSPGRTNRDAQALAHGAKLVRNISPDVDLSWHPVTHGTGHDWAVIHGSTPALAELYSFEVGRGRFLSDLDNRQIAGVCVMGFEIARQVFEPGEPIIGQVVRIDAQAFTVVGVLSRVESRQSGRNALWRRNWTVWIPLTTAQHRFTGSRKISLLEMQATDLARMVPAMEEVESILRPMHRWVRDFRVDNQLATLRDFGRQQGRLRAALGGVAALSLLIGGIGIMSVMLAGVNDRLREIGVRKSLGASNADIFCQFLVEAVALSLLGGLAGIAGGVMVVRFLGRVMEAPPVLVPEALVLGAAASIVMGVVAGLYPALRAASLNPIEALRAE